MPCHAPWGRANGHFTPPSIPAATRSCHQTNSPAPVVWPLAPLDPLIAFHTVFGKTVPDISLNAVANLGYAEGRWLAPVWPGDTLGATSEVIGLKRNSNGKSGVVWVRTTGQQPARRGGVELCPLGHGTHP